MKELSIRLGFIFEKLPNSFIGVSRCEKVGALFNFQQLFDFFIVHLAVIEARRKDQEVFTISVSEGHFFAFFDEIDYK